MHPKYHGTLDQKIQHNYSNQNYLIETEMISFYGSMQYDKLDILDDRQMETMT